MAVKNVSARRQGKRVRAVMAGSLILTGSVALSAPSPAQQQSASSRLSVPAGALESALLALGRQANLRLVYSSSLTSGKVTHGVSGQQTPQNAVAQLLAGTGLGYTFTGSNTVRIYDPSAGASSSPDGAVQLDTIDVTGGSSGGVSADLPYETRGSTSVITAEDLNRFPGLTSGAILQGTPGVISGSSNNGAAIDPNIRGLQGMNRVATTIDGSQQATSTYRGYSGVDSRTYVDPDLIGGVTITKGPDGGASGAIGGTVAMQTLGVSDILKDGDTYGVRVKGGLNTNSLSPSIGATAADYGEGKIAGNGSVAVASRQDNVDIVAAFVRRKTGNYFSGTEGDLTSLDYNGQQKKLSNYGYGQQVYNTSEDVTSGLLKATVRPADGHELQFGYLYYGNDFGEVSPSVISSGNNVTWQLPLSSVKLNQFTTRYRYKPADDDLVDFRANAYASNTDERNVYALLSSTGVLEQQARNFGVDIENTSRLSLAELPLSLRYGGTYALEMARPTSNVDAVQAWALAPNADREIATAFAKAKLEPLPWLALETGVEFLTYDTTFKGSTTYNYTGPAYTGYTGQGVSPSAGVTVTPLPGWQLFGQYSTGIRPPSLRETSFIRGDAMFNPDVKAEEASNFEVGTNILKNSIFLEGDKARLKLAYFDNTTNDYIGREFYNWSYMRLFNYDHVRFQGVELSGGYSSKLGFLDFGFNYYTDFEACLKNGTCMNYTKQADYLANQMPPKWSTSVKAGVHFWDERATIGGRVTYMSQRLAPLVPDSSYFWTTKVWAPYTVVDLFAQVKLNDSVTVDVGVQNLFDAYYVDALNNTDMPAPGRVISASLTAKLGSSEPLPWVFGDGPDGDPGMPWTGFYLGAHLGYGYGTTKGTTTAADGTVTTNATQESADQDLANILGGAQVGYNYQFGNGIVLGVEADFSRTPMADYREVISTEAEILTTRKMLQSRTDYTFDWLSTLRARAGYAFDNLFVYGTGGVAFLKETEERMQYRSNIASSSYPAGYYTETFFSEKADNVRTGFTVGAGAEYAFSRNWSLKGEYLFADFGAEDFIFDEARAGVTQTYSVTTRCSASNYTPPCRGQRENITTTYPGSSDTVNGRKASNDADLHMVKIGLNYRF
ncbi:TonB-dependent receptor domain-containing protein [Rhodomicrobium udaipurense]|nr:TonB-dependent receptor [Rhodomicrobium udaipurense]